MPDQYLVEHATKEVWCVPDQDLLSIFKPKRLSPIFGLRGTAGVEWQYVHLPDSTSNWHLYQIGDIHPSYLGMIPKLGRWISAADHCSNQGLIIDIYTKSGLNIPRFETFFAALPGRNLIMVVKDQGEILDLNTETLWTKFYSNAFFRTKRSHVIPALPDSVIMPLPIGDWHSSVYSIGPGIGGKVRVEGMRLNTRTELATLQARLRVLKDFGFGHVYAFYNGRFVNDLHQQWFTDGRFEKGDWAEYVFDASIKKVVDFAIADLDTFNSTLDELRKYLLHEYEAKSDTIDYRNDCDVFLTNKIGTYQEGDRFEGVYYAQNHDISLRQVTHQDFAIPVSHVLGYKNAVPSMTDPSKWNIRMHIRHGGFKRPLVFETNRIHDLYRLPPLERKQAFLGLNSNLSFWRAEVLEASNYVKIMDSPRGNFTRATVEQAYGYNAISKLVADSPLETIDTFGSKSVVLPIGLQHRATIYEYDANGRLLGYRPTTNTRTYLCQYDTCAFVEGRVGYGGNYLSTKYGTAPVTLEEDIDYGFYKRVMVDGEPTGDWLPAKAGTDYSIVNGVAHWNLDSRSWYCAVRDNKYFLTYTIDNDAQDGLLIFSLQANEDDPLAPANRVVDLLPSKVEVFLNGHPLIDGVDINRIGSQFVVCNKQFLSSAPVQRLVIIGTGIPQVKPEGGFVYEKPLDVGYVAWGQISRNKRYDIKDDKVLRFIVKGSVRLKRQLSFPEDGGVMVEGVTNGDPYCVEEVIVPIAQFTDTGTYELRNEAQVKDKAVIDYLTLKLPEPVEPNPNPIPERYEVYSPFIAKITHDLKNEHLVIPNLDDRFTDAQMEEWLKDYTYLLAYDPTRVPVDDAYVIVHPHDLYTVIELSVYQFHLVRRAARHWFNSDLQIAQFYSIADNAVPILP